MNQRGRRCCAYPGASGGNNPAPCWVSSGEPFKVDRGHIANYPSWMEFLGSWYYAERTDIEGYPQAASRLLDRVEDGLTFLCVNGQRFLSDDITAHFHCLDNIDVMSAVDTGNQDNIRLCPPLRSFSQTPRWICWLGSAPFIHQDVAGVVHPALVDITEGSYLAVFSM